MMSLAEIVIFSVGFLFSILSHCVAWAIHTKVSRVLERLKDCDDNIKSATKLVDNSAITGSVLQLSAEQLRFDPDVNEFERDVAVLMLKDPQQSYTGETMHRPNKPKMEGLPENRSKKSPKKPPVDGAGLAGPKRKVDSEEPEKENVRPSDNQKKVAPKDSRERGQDAGAAESEDEKNPNKKKFKPPPNIAKADAKDPAYETLQGIGNELFTGANKEEKKSKEDGPKEKKSKEDASQDEKNKFKQPQKIQKADAKDPQYETLADVKDDIFKG
ncbi:hypothetical protein RB195_020933 [Necator americanus]|uniref:Uncharacterized protein n=1 Tax=Necator americanus TaxID=51031 RepID=A0ABR1CM39_NECAM